MQLKVKFKFCAGNLLRISVLAGYVGAPLLFAQAADDVGNPAEEWAREAWRATMHEISAPGEGCFHGSYPILAWERVECAPAPSWRSARPKAKERLEIVGNGGDYVAQAPKGHVISSAVGSFPAVAGVTSESDGLKNVYSLQLNTNFVSGSLACEGVSGCLAWQQGVYSSSERAVFFQDWLIGIGGCPSSGGWYSDGEGDCYRNSAAASVPQIAITELSKLKLSVSAAAGLTDTVIFTNSTEAYTATIADKFTDIAPGWTQVEFNVFGDGGGSEAVFNKGSSITVGIVLSYGSTAAPTCVANGGTTGETNSLTLGKCTSAGGIPPSIEFTESN
jgi:hypothetical protein